MSQSPRRQDKKSSLHKAKKAPKKLAGAQEGKTRRVHKEKKAPKKLAGAQEGKTRSLHKAKKVPKKLAYAQEGKTRRVHKAKKAPKKLPQAQENRERSLRKAKKTPKKAGQEVYTPSWASANFLVWLLGLLLTSLVPSFTLYSLLVLPSWATIRQKRATKMLADTQEGRTRSLHRPSWA